jgi:hypothetical protein
MRRTVGWLLLLGLVVMLSGCVAGSLHPLYTDKDLVFDPGLVGKWQEIDQNDIPPWTFTKGEDATYTLTAEWKTDEGDTERSVCEAHLVSLGMYTFLDTYPSPTEADKGVIERYDYIGLHDQYLVKREEDVLRLATLNDDWLEEQILEGDLRPRIAVLEQNTHVLIGTTRELQRFFAYAAADPDAFTEFAVLKRVK